MLENLYNNFFLKYPKIIFTSLLLFTAVMFIFAMRLEIDASADTLLLEGDKDLAFASLKNIDILSLSKFNGR
jgi:predicted RND superfamily exporter protein